MTAQRTYPLARLDPDLLRAALNQPYVAHADPLLARKAFARAIRVSRALRGVTYPSDRVEVTHRSFPAPDDGREIGIRMYAPREGTAPAPVLVYFHGACVSGDLDVEHERCLRFAAEVGCAVVSVAYRRPPEHPFPAPTEDCFSAVRWVHDTAADWGADPARIAVAGSSSGATLAAAVALMARDRGGPRLALQMLLYPQLDDRLDTNSLRVFDQSPTGYQLDSRWEWRWYLGPDPAAPASPYAVPARCDDFTGVAPAYVLVAEVDPLRDEAIDYAIRMLRDGVRVELHQVARTFHGFDAAAPLAPVSVRALAEQCAALRYALGLT